MTMPIQTFPSLDDAIALAEFAHRNQRDQAGEPYIRHPMRVLRAVQEQGARPYVQIGAVLHDVTEDSAYTPQMLLDLGVLPAAVDIIKLADRDYSKKKWQDFVEAYAQRQEVWSHKTNVDTLLRDWTNKFIGSVDALNDPDVFYYANIRNNPGALQVKLADIGDNQLPWRVVYLPQARQERLNSKYTNALKLLTE